MVASIPSRHGGAAPIDMTYAADIALAKPGIPQGKVSAVTAKRMRQQIREAKKKEKEDAKENVKAENAAKAGVKFVEEMLVMNNLKVRSQRVPPICCRQPFTRAQCQHCFPQLPHTKKTRPPRPF